MKQLLIISFSMVISLASFATDIQPQQAKKPKLDGKAVMERIWMKSFGGKLRQPNTERGEIVFINTQKTVSSEMLTKTIDRLAKRYRFTLRISDKDVERAPGRFIVRLEDLDRKARVILAPEDRWVSVNVKSLAADNPPKAILNDRFEKEVRRAFAFVCGGTCGTEPLGLCRLVDKLEDLDAIPGLDYSLDMEARIINNLRAAGVEPYRLAKYSDAVKEGWAPAPTNEYQKAIWEKVRSEKERGPAKAIKILPPKK